MRQKREMRPTSRPKQERRMQNRRPRPQSHYNKRQSARKARAQTFHMPEDRLEQVPRWKLAVFTILFTLALFGIGYAFGYVAIGHFIKGWW